MIKFILIRHKSSVFAAFLAIITRMSSATCFVCHEPLRFTCFVSRVFVTRFVCVGSYYLGKDVPPIKGVLHFKKNFKSTKLSTKICYHASIIENKSLFRSHTMPTNEFPDKCFTNPIWFVKNLLSEVKSQKLNWCQQIPVFYSKGFSTFLHPFSHLMIQELFTN